MTDDRLAPVIWTAAGRELEAEDWAANTSLGGHDSARVTLAADEAADLGQGQVIGAHLPGGEEVWEGTLTADPTVRFDGLADLDGLGHRARIEGRSGRLLYMTRDYSLFSDAEDEPFAITGYGAQVQFDAKGNHLLWTIPPGTGAGTRGAAIWVPNTPGGITRYAFDSLLAKLSTGTSTLTVSRFTGPTGARTVVAAHTYGSGVSSLSIDQTITSPEDALLFEFAAGSGYDAAAQWAARTFNLRVNGIAIGDTMTAAQVIADIGARCGLDPSLIAHAGVNALPLDVQAGESWSRTIEYLAMIDGDKVPLVLGGDRPQMRYRKFEDRVYEVRIDEGATPTLRPLPRFNYIRVVWSNPAGGARDVYHRVPSAGLPEGVVQVFTVTVRDPQKDSTTADQVANALMAGVSRRRYQGTLAVVEARLDGVGDIDPRTIEPGAFARVADWGPSQARELRIFDVAKGPNGVTLGIEDPAGAESYLARRDFAAAQMAGLIRFRSSHLSAVGPRFLDPGDPFF